MMIMVSMCLAGVACRYDGGGKLSPLIDCLARQGETITLICPECMGGLQTPREPAEIIGGTGEDVLDGVARIVNRVGEDVTDAFLRGAQATLALAERLQPTAIYLKSRSPSCGAGEIYDGTFSGTRISGDGLTAALLRRAGFSVIAAD